MRNSPRRTRERRVYAEVFLAVLTHMANELRCKGLEKLIFLSLWILSFFMGEESSDKDFADKMKTGTRTPSPKPMAADDDTDGADLNRFFLLFVLCVKYFLMKTDKTHQVSLRHYI